ncbi:DUF4097 family beta strand repeat-containing protein [Nocardia stercoris]|nr:DUF4097 family beta strand repeat-containing protein [Nocardia stercoris]
MNRLMISIIACGLAVAGLSACSDTSPHKTKSVTYQESSPVHTLVIKGNVGDIKVSGEGTSVNVTEQHRFQSVDPVTSHALTDGTLTLSYTCNDAQCTVDYTVVVPAGTEVQISDSTGDITLAKLAGTVDATTGVGKITADGLSGPQAHLTTDTGDVMATFTASPSSVVAQASTGDVKIAVPHTAKYAVDGHATTGEVHVDVPQDAGSADTITAKVGTGNVTVADA